jgi:glycosyltransferase involved in cell wall biosynthesis
MKIDILTVDGSPIGVCPMCVWGDDYRVGIGGSELYLMTLCEAWTNAGHQVRLYNNPHMHHTSLDQRYIDDFYPDDDRDVLINFRTPSSFTEKSKGLKLWLTCDQYSHGDYAEFAKVVDKVICISPYHVDFFKKVYGIENATYIDIPVRGRDFVPQDKIKNRLIFTSVPDRGLSNLWRMYPKLKKAIPDLSLVITSDYRLWGVTAQNEVYRRMWLEYRDSIKFIGAAPRRVYLDELSKAELMVYPCNYDELFCISVAEAQWAGVYPITSSIGALKTTNMGLVLDVDANSPSNDDLFINKVVHLLKYREEIGFDLLQEFTKENARIRFSLENILQQWEGIFK